MFALIDTCGRNTYYSNNLRDQLDGYSVEFEKFVALNPFKRRNLLRDI